MRVLGIDFARALAIIGMIIVNFKMVIGANGGGWLLDLADSFSGKAAALFVTLAGVGIALMTQRGFDTPNISLRRKGSVKLLKRSLLLFIIGLSYITIWPADILHFYGVYMLVTFFFIYRKRQYALVAGIVIILLYPLMMMWFDYDQGWNFDTLEYQDFWSISGFLRNLFYNGFHPVFPWVSFMLIGLWYGRHDLRNTIVVKSLLRKSIFVFIVVFILSKLLLKFTLGSDPLENEQLTAILGLSPMPPLILYMLAGSSLSIAVISFCIVWIDRYKESYIVKSLVNTGKLALTIYVAHVVLGMGLIFAYDESMIGKHTIAFSIGYALIFSVACVIFSNIWLTYFKSGPLEWLFNKILG